MRSSTSPPSTRLHRAPRSDPSSVCGHHSQGSSRTVTEHECRRPPAVDTRTSTRRGPGQRDRRLADRTRAPPCPSTSNAGERAPRRSHPRPLCRNHRPDHRWSVRLSGRRIRTSGCGASGTERSPTRPGCTRPRTLQSPGTPWCRDRPSASCRRLFRRRCSSPRCREPWTSSHPSPGASATSAPPPSCVDRGRSAALPLPTARWPQLRRGRPAPPGTSPSRPRRSGVPFALSKSMSASSSGVKVSLGSAPAPCAAHDTLIGPDSEFENPGKLPNIPSMPPPKSPPPGITPIDTSHKSAAWPSGIPCPTFAATHAAGEASTWKSGVWSSALTPLAPNPPAPIDRRAANSTSRRLVPARSWDVVSYRHTRPSTPHQHRENHIEG